MATFESEKTDIKDGGGDNGAEGQEMVAPAGTKLWAGTSKLTTGASLGAVSGVWKTALVSIPQLTSMRQYDTNARKFSQFVKVEHDKAFTLKPLILTSGPLKGYHVLMLQESSFPAARSSSPFSPFMELAAELRCKIYGHLLEENEPIRISAYKRRPVREGYGYELRKNDKGLMWDVRSGKWIDQPPSNMAILQVSKRILQEAAPIAYSNEFSFAHEHYVGGFLRAIGSMRQYVKHIDLPAYLSDHRDPFRYLSDMRSLRSVKITCNSSARYSGEPQLRKGEVERFVEDIKVPLDDLNWTHKGDDSQINVLDIVQVTSRGCLECHETRGDRSSCEACNRLLELRDEIATQLRSLLADALEIEE